LLVLLFTAAPFSAFSSAAVLVQGAYDGNWSGTTSQGKPFSFTASSGTIIQIETQFVLPGCTVTQTLTGNFAITGNTFSVSVSSTSIQGTFVSLSFASGNAQFTSFNPFCSGTVKITWSAARITPIPPITPTPSATATTTPTATNIAATVTPAGAPTTNTPTPGDVYLSLVVKQDPPTLTPTPTSTSTPPPAGERPRISVQGAREETELRCSSGVNSYIQRPAAGYTFVVVDFKVTNPKPGQILTFNRSDVSIIAGDGAVYPAEGDNFERADSYCLGGSAIYGIPSAEASYSFVFVPRKDTITQNYKLHFPNAEDVTFKATPK
jgi:hypothetical protein